MMGLMTIQLKLPAKNYMVYIMYHSKLVKIVNFRVFGLMMSFVQEMKQE